MNTRVLGVCMMSSLLGTVACKTQEAAKGEAPPAASLAPSGLCDRGGGELTDPPSAAILVRAAGSYCLDPNSPIRAYGKDAKRTLEQVCTELVDGECEVYRYYGMVRVVSVRYVDGGGTPGSIAVRLSLFDSAERAFGFFGRRAVADSDVTQLSAKPLNAGAAGAIGAGVAYVWRGRYVAELAYSNETEAPEALRASSLRVLPALAQALGERTPGEMALPPVARWLPEASRIPLAVVMETENALQINGTGPGVFGYYLNDNKRYRVLVMERPNEPAASDVLKTLRRVEGARESKGPAFTTLSFDLPRPSRDGAKIGWVVGRTANIVIGVGDDDSGPLSDPPNAPSPQSLSVQEKTEKLSSILRDIAQRYARPGQK